jgi:hypothetical protein
MPTHFIAHSSISRTGIADLRTKQGQIDRAIELRAEELRTIPDGKRPRGAELLIDAVKDEAARQGVQLSNKGLVSPSHLRRFLAAESEDSKLEFIQIDQQDMAIRSFLNRLAKIKAAFGLGQGITKLELQAAERVLAELNDPLGDVVGLVAQFAVIFELGQRRFRNAPVHDIDDYFTYAPWHSDKNRELYRVAITHKIAVPPQLIAICPFMPLGTHAVDPRYIGFHYQLGVPYALNFRTDIEVGDNATVRGYRCAMWKNKAEADAWLKANLDLSSWQLHIQLGIEQQKVGTIRAFNLEGNSALAEKED